MSDTRDNANSLLDSNLVNFRPALLFLSVKNSISTDLDPNINNGIVFSAIFCFVIANVGLWGCYFGLLVLKSVKATQI
jgi:hypothetical protein